MANIRLSVGELPLGIEDIEPSTDGSSPAVLSTPQGSVSAVFPLIFWCDTAGYEKSTDLVIPAVDTRVRFSADGVNWSGWGEGVTITAPITVSGKSAYLQVRGLPGDTGSLPLKLIIEQGGIAEATSTTLPSVIDYSTPVEFAALINIGLFSATESPNALDYSSMGYGGLISPIGTVTEAATNSEVASLIVFAVIPSGAESGSNVDDSSITLVGVLASTSESAAGADASEMATAPPSETVTTADMFINDGDNDAVPSGALATTQGGSTTVPSGTEWFGWYLTQSTTSFTMSLGYSNGTGTNFTSIGSGSTGTITLSGRADGNGEFTIAHSISVVVSGDTDIPSGSYLAFKLLNGTSGGIVLYGRKAASDVAKVKAGTYTATISTNWFEDLEGAPDYTCYNATTGGGKKFASLQYVTR